MRDCTAASLAAAKNVSCAQRRASERAEPPLRALRRCCAEFVGASTLAPLLARCSKLHNGGTALTRPAHRSDCVEWAFADRPCWECGECTALSDLEFLETVLETRIGPPHISRRHSADSRDSPRLTLLFRNFNSNAVKIRPSCAAPRPQDIGTARIRY